MIRTDRVLVLLDQIEAKLRGLDGLDEKNINTNDKHKAARRADVSRQLLYAAHLADAASLEIMNQYYSFKGEDPPQIIPTPTGGNE